MTQDRPPYDPERVEGDADPIARVLKFAGSRPQPDADRKAEFKKALRAEWHRAIESAPRAGQDGEGNAGLHAGLRSGSRAAWRSDASVGPRSASRGFGKAMPKRGAVALAAGIAGVTGIAGLGGIAAMWFIATLVPARVAQPPVPPQLVGQVVRTEGVVRKTDGRTGQAASNPGLNAAISVTAGEDVRAGTLLDTSATGRMALALGPDISLRMDVDSRIVMIGERIVRLERGAIYVDVDARAGKRGALLVHTPYGDVRDIGTQFEVRARGAAFGVRVREGEILIDRGGDSGGSGGGSGGGGPQMTARAGEGLYLDREGRYVRTTIPISGPEWAWTSAIAPQFQLEGGTVRQFLDWVAREQGWRWRFADSDTARRAAGIVTHGSLEGYTPEEALAIVLPTCGLSFVQNGDEVVVSFAKEF